MEEQQREAPASRPVTRRQFGRWGWIAALVAFLGAQAWVLLKLFSTPTASHQEQRVVVGPLDRFPPGSVTHVRKEHIFLIRQPAGLLALSHYCSHQRCVVQYIAEQDVLFCPCHGARFSVTGAVLAGPATRPLDRFAATVEEGQVVVHTAQSQ